MASKKKRTGCWYLVKKPGTGTGHAFKTLKAARNHAKKRSKTRGDMNVARECYSPRAGEPHVKTLVRCRKGACHTQSAWEANKGLSGTRRKKR